jgi:hypothetical protein
VTRQRHSATYSATYQRPNDRDLFGCWFQLMSEPGCKEDGSDTAWFVVDLRAKRPAIKYTTYVGDGAQAQPEAEALARERNIKILTRRIRYHRRKYHQQKAVSGHNAPADKKEPT